MLRSLFLASLGLMGGTAVAMAQETPGPVQLLGEFVLPTGLKIEGVAFGGISGLDYDPATDTYYAISDDRAQNGPARFYELKLLIDAEGVHGVDIVATHFLLDLDGKAFVEGDVDPEAIRYDGARKSIFWSSEGDLEGQPAIFEADLTGKALRQFAVPEAYLPNADKTRGVYGNLAFESLAISPDGKTLFAGTENALVQDGDEATLEAGSKARIIGFDIESGQPSVEYLYETDPIFIKSPTAPFYNDNGLSDFVLLDDHRLVTVERSFASGLGNQITFYITDLSQAQEVTGAETLAEDVVGASKQEWFKIGEGDFGLDIDNIEAITFGPEIDGRKSVVIASDNNFNPDGQFTQFVAFTIGE